MMFYIPCGSDCIYQAEGVCQLDQAGSPGMPGDAGCVYYRRRAPAGAAEAEAEEESAEY